MPLEIEGKLSEYTELLNAILVLSGSISINAITTNNRPLYVGTSSVPVSTRTTIVTSPANGIEFITKIVCSSENNAKWEIYIDSVLKETKRTTDRNVVFSFGTPLKKLAAEVLDVKVIFEAGPTAQCDATIYGYAVTP